MSFLVISSLFSKSISVFKPSFISFKFGLNKVQFLYDKNSVFLDQQ